jgi:nitroreductase
MFLELLQQRRSIRTYTDQPVEKEKLDRIVAAALRSPSSRSLMPWSFVVVTDPGVLKRLSRAKPHGASFLGKAPAAVVICADPERCDVWVEDAAIATILIHLAAADLGLGSCWIQIRKRANEDGRPAAAHVREALNIPEKLEIEAIVALGYPGETKKPHGRTSLPWDRVFAGQYGTPYEGSGFAASGGTT